MRSGSVVSRWQGVIVLVVLSLMTFEEAHADRWRNWPNNSTPQITGTPPTDVVAGQTYTFRPVATDADGDRLGFSIRNQPRWASFDKRTGELRGTPGSANVGSHADIQIIVSDLRSYAALPKFTIQVSSGTTPRSDQPPTIGGTPATAVTAGSAYAFQPTASDPEGAPLSFAIRNRPSWANFDASSGRLWGTPAASHVGSYGAVGISVTDGQSLTDLAPFDIQVNAAPNQAPHIAGSPATSVTAAQTYSFTPSASDADGDPLTFSIQNRPAWATFSTSNGRLSGTPTSAQVGTCPNVVISVSDGKTAAALPAFGVEVTPAPNRAPTITGQPAGSVTAGQPYSFTPAAGDPDGDVLSFAIQNRPAWASFDASTGRVSGTPTTANVGTYGGIAISVTDGQTFTDLAPFSIQVTAAPNQAPVITGTPSSSVTAGQAYSFSPSASDGDGDALTFSVQNLPAWATFSTSNGRLSGTPTSAQVGTYPNVVISVSDGKASASLAPFSIAVSAVPNRAPTITGQPATSVTAGQPYSFTPSASDADGDALTFSIQNLPAWATFSSSTGRMSGTPTSAQVGTYPNVVISVSDGKASASLAPFSVAVSAVPNRAPTITGQPATSVTADQPYSFTPAANDPDGDVLTFSIQNRPAWATLSPSTGRLSGTPSGTQAGTYPNVVITVSDGKASASLPAFSVIVEPVVTRSVTLSWQAPTQNEDGTPLTNLAGYEVHYGQTSGQYSQTLPLPDAGFTSVTVEDLTPATWYFAVKAVNSAGVVSSFSNEASKAIN